MFRCCEEESVEAFEELMVERRADMMLEEKFAQGQELYYLLRGR